jgi:hypothetical protein
MNKRIVELGKNVKLGLKTWDEIAKQINDEFGSNLSSEAVRNRYRRNYNNEDVETTNREYTTEYSSGIIEAQKIVEYNQEIFGDKKKLLEYLGFNSNEWEFVYVTTSTWNQHTKEQTTKQLYAVKFKVKPLFKDISVDDALEVAKELFSKEIEPLKIKIHSKDNSLNKNKLLEIPAIELHLGKMAWGGDTGQDYDKNIATNRFYHILEEVVNIQYVEKCETALITIGNDFFNSDTVNATTTKGTPQTNDLRWKKMFLLGLKLYIEFLETLRDKFNKIDVRLCSGNHDKMSSFYLYLALQQYFRSDDKIIFSENYKDYQCYQFGKCAIFFGHGDSNLKRIIQSIPAEFYKEWGSSIFRELHLGHLHKEVVVDDESGMITRRIGSPTGTDQYHYEERFVGATQKHQVFVWDANNGLKSIEYINFENSKKKIIRR